MRESEYVTWGNSLPVRAIGVLYVAIVVSMISAGCSSMRVSTVFNNAAPASPHATLALDNRTVIPLMVRAPIIVTVDNQSVAEGALQKGITEIRLHPGTHTITHTGKATKQAMYGYQYASGSGGSGTPTMAFGFKPITTEFKVEAGKAYKIIFRLDLGAQSCLGYLIDYEGWSYEEKSLWPTKNHSDMDYR